MTLGQICNMIPLKDKGCHFIAGMIVVILGLVFATKGISILALITVAIGKELIVDLWIRRTFFDYWDMFFTICGGFAVMFSYAIMEAVISFL